MKKVEKSFGDRILALRLAKGWTMEDVARRIDVSTGAVGNWENAPEEKPMIPHAKTLAKLAAVLETTINYLLHGEIPDPESPEELRQAADHWKDRAENAERELEQIKSVLRTTAGNLAEVAGASYDKARRSQGNEEASELNRRLREEVDQILPRRTSRKRGPGESASGDKKGQ